MHRGVLGLLLVAMMAGCADAPTEAEEAADPFEDAPVEVTAETGAIRGVVFNDAIVPVDGATVILGSGDAARTTLSDDQGRFSFSKVEPGTHFLSISKPGHDEVQVAASVVAGIAEPPVVKVQIARLFAADPYMSQTSYQGHIQCSQAGIVYSSAPCITDWTSLVTGTVVPPGCQTSGCAPALRTIQSENRGFHEDVATGWQTLIWDMSWEPSAQGTSQNMGIVASQPELERCSCHNYMSYTSANPLRAQIDVGVDHPDSNSVDPELIPEEGHEQLYFFISIRRESVAPAVALEQDFQLFFSQFYYAPAPEGWSFINGDGNPF